MNPLLVIRGSVLNIWFVFPPGNDPVMRRLHGRVQEDVKEQRYWNEDEVEEACDEDVCLKNGLCFLHEMIQ